VLQDHHSTRALTAAWVLCDWDGIYSNQKTLTFTATICRHGCIQNLAL
jgi:hypothetical protein